MPVSFLSQAERERLDSFPREISGQDAVIYFTLSRADQAQVPQTSQDRNRLGFVLQLCALRYLGFYPTDLGGAPGTVIQLLAGQVQANPVSIEAYGQRLQTVNDHQRQIETYLGYTRLDPTSLGSILEAWLFERALEHDKPALLFQMACEKLHQDKIVRPGISVIERTVAAARYRARRKTYEILKPIVERHRAFLDRLLVRDESKSRTILNRLGRGAVSNSSAAILRTLKKLKVLEQGEVAGWDLREINPNRRKFLAQLGRRSTNQALLRTSEDLRYPALITFLRQLLEEINDELIDLFDRYLSGKYSRSKNKLDDFRKSAARATNEKVWLLREIASVLLDSSVPNEEVRQRVYGLVPEEKLRHAARECDRLARPLDDNFLDLAFL